MSATDIMTVVRNTLQSRSRSIDYEQASELKFALRKSGVYLELEVFKGHPLNSLKIRKVAGDHFEYDRICRELLEGMKL